jgi:hypothetical protein
VQYNWKDESIMNEINKFNGADFGKKLKSRESSAFLPGMCSVRTLIFSSSLLSGS